MNILRQGTAIAVLEEREPLSLKGALVREPTGLPKAELGRFASRVGSGVDGSFKRRSSVSCDPMYRYGKDVDAQPFWRDN